MAGGQLAQVALAFAFVVALMLAISWLFKRFGLEKKWGMARSSAGLLHVDDTLFLDAKRRMMVVRMQSTQYVVLLDNERAQVIDMVERDT